MCVCELFWPLLGAGAVPSEQVPAPPGSLSGLRGLVCAGPAALGHQGDRARWPPTTWLPQKHHSEQRLLSLHSSVPHGHQDSGCIQLVLRLGLLCSASLALAFRGGHLHLQMHRSETTAPLWVSFYLKFASAGSSSQSSVIWGGGQSSLGTSGWTCTGAASCLF